MRLLSQSLKDTIIQEFPNPIADTFWDFIVSQTKIERFDRLLDIFRITLKYTAFVMLLKYLNINKFENKTNLLISEISTKMLRKGLTDGEYVQIIRELSRFFINLEDNSIVHEIAKNLFKNKRSAREEVLQIFDSLLSFRNRHRHGVTGSEEYYGKIIKNIIPTFERFFEIFMPLCNYPLIVCKNSNILNQKDKFKILYFKLMGVTPPRSKFLINEFILNHSLIRNQTYIIDNKNFFISLAPLFDFGKIESNKDENLYIYESIKNKGFLLISHPIGYQKVSRELYIKFKKQVENKLQSEFILQDSALDVFNNVKFVGRKKERDLFRKIVSEILKEHGKLLFIEGEMGIGKTQLVNYFIENEIPDGIRAIKGEYTKDILIPFKGIKQAIEEFFDIAVEDTRDDIQKKIYKNFNEKEIDKELLFFIVNFLRPKSIKKITINLNYQDLDFEKSILFENLSRILFLMAKYDPLIIFLDDLQWADIETIEFLYYFINLLRHRNKAICIAGAFRPEGISKNPKFIDILGTFSRYTGEFFYKKKLEPLEFTEMEFIVKTILPLLAQKDVEFICSKAAGNPFFLLQILRYLYDCGLIKKYDKVWRIDYNNIQGSIFPDSIKEVIYQRLQRIKNLPNGKNLITLLNLSAVLGKKFSYKILLELLNEIQFIRSKKFDKVYKLLEFLQEISIFKIQFEKFSEAPIISFSNNLIQEILYQDLKNLEPFTLRQYHLLIAKILNKQFEDSNHPQRMAIETSYHYLAGGDHKKAVEFLKVGALHAIKELSYSSAVKLLIKALNIVKRRPELGFPLNLEAELSLYLGKIYEIIGEWEKAIKLISWIPKKKEISTKIILQAVQCLAVVYMNQCSYKNSQIQIEKLFQLSKLNDYKEGVILSQLLMAKLKMEYGEYQSAKDNLIFLIKKIESTQCSDLLKSEVFQELGRVYVRLNRYKNAINVFERCLDIKKKLKDLRGIGRILHEIGKSYSDLGDNHRALFFISEAQKYREKVQDKRRIGYSLYEKAKIYLNMGNFRDAEVVIKEGLGIMQKLKDVRGIILFLRETGIYKYSSGQYQEALKYFNRALELAQKIGYKRGIAYCHRCIAMVLLDQHKINEASKHLKIGLRILTGMEDKKGLNQIYREMGKFEILNGNINKGKILINKSIKIAKEIGYKRGIAYSKFLLSKVNLEGGLVNEGKKIISEALSLMEEMEDLRGIKNIQSYLTVENK